MAWNVLVLDKALQPIEVVGWEDAVVLLVTGKAEVVEEYEDVDIRSEKMTFKLPSVLRLLTYFAKRKPLVRFSRYNIFLRDNWCCQYCGGKRKSEDLTFDHVTPVVQGGRKSWENIVAACMPCNRKKGGRTPEQAGMRLLRKPVQPRLTPVMTIRLTATTPESWRSYLYWHSELERDPA